MTTPRTTFPSAECFCVRPFDNGHGSECGLIEAAVRYRELAPITGADGATWTPSIPRRYLVAGKFARVVRTWVGPTGTTWAQVACLSAPIPHGFPRVVAANSLTEV